MIETIYHTEEEHQKFKDKYSKISFLFFLFVLKYKVCSCQALHGIGVKTVTNDFS